MAFSLRNILVVLISYVIMLVAGHFIVEAVVSRLWKRYLPSMERHTPLPAIVGTLDRFLFATSLFAWRKGAYSSVLLLN